MQKIIKPLLILIALVGLEALVYVFIIKKSATTPVQTGSLARTTANGTSIPLAPTAEAQPNINVAQDVEKFKKLLDQLNTIKLNPSVFQNSQYPNLIDNTSLALEELDRIKNAGTLGKDNPFLGFEGGTPTIVLQGSASVANPTPRTTPRR